MNKESIKRRLFVLPADQFKDIEANKISFLNILCSLIPSFDYFVINQICD